MLSKMGRVIMERQNQIEPTYLRYVHDNLKKGGLSADNASGLPNGFAGIFEEHFGADISVQEKQERLGVFTCFALLKKEVSSYFIAQVLGKEEQWIKALIASHSNWFNSPEPGLYKLYHDRLRVFFLQKQSKKAINAINEKIISKFEEAIENKKGDELELYALEFLAEHMYLSSQQGSEYQRLHDFVNDKELWSRQIELSNAYEWSQRMVSISVKEGARLKNKKIVSEGFKSLAKLTKKLKEDVYKGFENNDILLDHNCLLEKFSPNIKHKLYSLYVIMLLSSEDPISDKIIKQLDKAIDILGNEHDLSNWTEDLPIETLMSFSTKLFNLGVNIQSFLGKVELDYSFYSLEYIDELILEEIKSNREDWEKILINIKVCKSDSDFVFNYNELVKFLCKKIDRQMFVNSSKNIRSKNILGSKDNKVRLVQKVIDYSIASFLCKNKPTECIKLLKHVCFLIYDIEDLNSDIIMLLGIDLRFKKLIKKLIEVKAFEEAKKLIGLIESNKDRIELSIELHFKSTFKNNDLEKNELNRLIDDVNYYYSNAHNEVSKIEFCLPIIEFCDKEDLLLENTNKLISSNLDFLKKYNEFESVHYVYYLLAEIHYKKGMFETGNHCLEEAINYSLKSNDRKQILEDVLDLVLKYRTSINYKNLIEQYAPSFFVRDKLYKKMIRTEMALDKRAPIKMIKYVLEDVFSVESDVFQESLIEGLILKNKIIEGIEYFEYIYINKSDQNGSLKRIFDRNILKWYNYFPVKENNELIKRIIDSDYCLYSRKCFEVLFILSRNQLKSNDYKGYKNSIEQLKKLYPEVKNKIINWNNYFKLIVEISANRFDSNLLKNETEDEKLHLLENIIELIVISKDSQLLLKIYDSFSGKIGLDANKEIMYHILFSWYFNELGEYTISKEIYLKYLDTQKVFKEDFYYLVSHYLCVLHLLNNKLELFRDCYNKIEYCYSKTRTTELILANHKKILKNKDLIEILVNEFGLKLFYKEMNIFNYLMDSDSLFYTVYHNSQFSKVQNEYIFLEKINHLTDQISLERKSFKEDEFLKILN